MLELVLAVAAYAVAVLVLALGVKLIARVVFGPTKRLEAELGLDALRGRVKRGEITIEEFNVARRALGFGEDDRLNAPDSDRARGT